MTFVVMFLTRCLDSLTSVALRLHQRILKHVVAIHVTIGFLSNPQLRLRLGIENSGPSSVEHLNNLSRYGKCGKCREICNTLP